MVAKGLMRPVTFEGTKMPLHNTIVVPAKAGIQYAAALAIEPQRLWNAGSSAFAGYDRDPARNPVLAPGKKRL
jgi:hypothetical protein